MGEELKPIELTEQEKQTIEKTRKLTVDKDLCFKEIEAMLKKYNCYITLNGNIQIAGDKAFNQIQIQILNKQ